MRKHTLTAGVVAGVLLLAACGGDDEPAATEAPDVTVAATSTPAAATAPAPSAASAPATGTASAAPTSEATGSSPARDEADGPQAIISLAPTHTETLFAIGAGDQVIAVDDQSDFPAEAAAVSSDLSGFEPNVEAIAGYEPDLVVLSDATIQPQLESLGIAVWVGAAPATFEDAYAQIEQLGAVTGHIAEAAELVAQMRGDIESVIASVPAPETPLTVYHELDNTYYSVNSSTFIGQVYLQFGLQNIADRAEGDSGGYPQLNAEAIISADPDLIFLADASFGESAETVSARPGWQDITAVTSGAIFTLDEDTASRWGPRVVDFVQAVGEAVTAVAVPAGG